MVLIPIGQMEFMVQYGGREPIISALPIIV